MNTDILKAIAQLERLLDEIPRLTRLSSDVKNLEFPAWDNEVKKIIVTNFGLHSKEAARYDGIIVLKRVKTQKDKENAYLDVISQREKAIQSIIQEYKHVLKQTNKVKSMKSEKLRRLIISSVITVFVAVLGYFIWWLISSNLPTKLPLDPNVVSVSSSNPIVNTDTSQSIAITANPLFVPPYKIEILETIQNNNSLKCYMVLEFTTSEGFKFLPIVEILPDNITIEEGYEYKNIMKVYIKDFAPKFSYNLKLTVYTMNPEIYGGTEKITVQTLEKRYE